MPTTLLLTHCSTSSLPATACHFDSDCPSGTFCNAKGFCAAGIILCDSDQECPAGQFCIDGVCGEGSPDGGTGQQDGGTTDNDEDQNTDDPVVARGKLLVVDPGLHGYPPVHLIDFGDIRAHQRFQRSVVVKNIGEGDLEISAISFDPQADYADFSLPDDWTMPIILAPGQPLSFNVYYEAGDGQSDYGVLKIYSDDPDNREQDVQLQAVFRGLSAAHLSRDNLSFGDVSLSVASQPMAVLLSNHGTHNSVLQVREVFFDGMVSPDFAVYLTGPGFQEVHPPVLLNDGETLRLEVIYHPQMAEQDTGVLKILTSDPDHFELEISLSGQGIPSDLEIQPRPVDLGMVRIGQMGQQQVTIANTTAEDIWLNAVYLAGTSPEWSLSSQDLNLGKRVNSPVLLEAGRSVGLLVTFLPLDAGFEHGQLVIENSTSQSEIMVALHAVADLAPQITVDPDPASLDFGNVQVDLATGRSETRSMSLVIRNSGGGVLRIGQIELSPDTSDEFSWEPASLPPILGGQQEVLTVSFEPRELSERQGGLLVVDTNDSGIELDGVPGRFQVELSARVIDPRMAVSPRGVLDFSEVLVGMQKTLIVTVENDSVHPLDLVDVRLSAGTAEAYSLGALPELPRILNGPGESVVLEVNYLPLDLTAATGILEIRSSDIGNPEVLLSLTGRGSLDCPTGMTDCDGDPLNGCETDTVSDNQNCGACGVLCSNDHGTAACVNGACSLVCEDLWGDCDGNSRNGCETQLSTLDACGDCGASCRYPNALAECLAGVCEFSGCQAGYANCDGNLANGCETGTLNDPDNCGACGGVCYNPHGPANCVNGTCNMDCDANWGDCDGNPANGCESNLNTADHCGACNAPCHPEHGTGACNAGTCYLTSCDSNYLDCDNDGANGCEIALKSNLDCSNAIQLSPVCGDQNHGYECPPECVHGPSASGVGERYFAIYVDECSICDSDMRLRARLTSPPGTNYDLIIHDHCGSQCASSTSPAGVLDEATCTHPDPLGLDDGRWYYIEIRHVSGNSCSSWNLQTRGGCPDGW